MRHNDEAPAKPINSAASPIVRAAISAHSKSDNACASPARKRLDVSFVVILFRRESEIQHVQGDVAPS